MNYLIKYKKPNTFVVDDLTLRGGINKVDKEKWERVSKNPFLAARVGEDVIVLSKPDADVKNPIETLAKMSVEKAVENVSFVVTKDDLEVLKKVEKREKVLKAIDKQEKNLEIKTV